MALRGTPLFLLPTGFSKWYLNCLKSVLYLSMLGETPSPSQPQSRLHLHDDINISASQAGQIRNELFIEQQV